MGMMSELDIERRYADGYLLPWYETDEQAFCVPVQNTRETVSSPVSAVKRTERYHNEKILDFVRCICSTQNFANSIRMIKTKRGRNAEHGFGTLAFFRQNDEEQMRYWLNTIRFDRNRDYYITKNSYSGDKSRTETLFSLDNIVIDIDNHKKINSQKLDRQIDHLIWILDNDFNGRIPPYGIVYSGCGVQLWIGLESVPATEKWQYRYRQLTEYFCDFLENIIRDYGICLEVDRAASVRVNGFVRLPETWNAKRKDGRKVIAERFPLYRMHIYDILEGYTDIPFDRKRKPAPEREKACRNVQKKVCKPQNRNNYTPYMMKCMRFIERLVEECHGECNGRRELMLFHYYNCAIQVYEKEIATAMVKELNQKFSVPLRSTEVSCAINSPDKKVYHYSKKQFLSGLCVSEKEKQLYDACTHSRKKDREQARQKKQERDAKIESLQQQGLNQQKIAEEIGCARQTVSKVAGTTLSEKCREEIEKLYLDGVNTQEIADRLNCSKKTVERVVKSRNLAEIRREKRNETIVALYTQGKSQKEIAEIVGCSRQTAAAVVSEIVPESTVPENQEKEAQEKEQEKDIPETRRQWQKAVIVDIRQYVRQVFSLLYGNRTEHFFEVYVFRESYSAGFT